MSALDILSRAKQACMDRMFDWFYEEKWGTHTYTLTDILEAYRTASGAWDYILRTDSVGCTCGHHLAFRMVCPECTPPDGQD